MIYEINKWGSLTLLFFIIPLLSHEWMGEQFQLFNWVFIKLFAAQLMYGVGFVLFVLQLCVHNSFTIKTNSVHIYVLIFLLVLTLFTVFSKYPNTSRQEWIMFMTFLAGYFVTSQLVENKRDLIVVFYLLISASVIVVLYGWYQCGWRWSGVPNSTIGNKNFFANYLTLNIFPAGALLVTSILRLLHYNAACSISKGRVIENIQCLRRENKIAPISIFLCLFISFTLMMIGIFLGNSMGAYAGFLAGMISVFFMLARSFKKKIFLIAIVLLIFTALFYSVPALQELVNEKMKIRTLLWESSWLMFKANFWKGQGLGTFFIFFPQYRLPEYFAVTDSVVTVSRHAHNELLQIGCEVGIWGVAAFVAIFIVLGFNLSGIVKKQYQKLHSIVKAKNEYKASADDDGDIIILQLGLFGGIMGVLAHDMFSVDLRFSSIGIPFWANVGLLVGSMQIVQPSVKTIYLQGICTTLFKSWGNFVIVIASIISFIIYTKSIVFHPFMAERNFYLGLKEKSKKNVALSTEYFIEAVKHDPYNQSILYKLAHNYGLMGDFQKSLKTYLKLAELAPNYSRLQSNLGKVYLQLGNFPEAINNLKQALLMNPFDVEDHLALFKAYDSMKMIKEAKKELELALRLKPNSLQLKNIYEKYKNRS